MAKKKRKSAGRTRKITHRKLTRKASKKLLIILAGFVLILIALFVLQQIILKNAQPSYNFNRQSYSIDSQQLIVGQDTKITNQTTNPSKTRGAAILIDNPGGSGTFYYLLGAMQKENQIAYASPILLGDRIKIISVTVDDPQKYDNGIVTVKYLDRKENATMTDTPTVLTTKQFAFEEDGNLIELFHQF